ncbi:MarC family protein [Candidatus Similichlamydia epinepheli]|uniref:MarC family protein n=1 Tax=Candidatus Similichlamydia epinepheli TaxID=1903953 RepID=UPI000D36C3C0|nr:MarC family protein [Candidatus Similichlamydia epinepheli]
MDFSIILARSVQLFFLLGPLSSAPIVVTITRKMSKKDGVVLVFRECLFAGLLCILFNHGGASALANLGISIHALRFAGGILLCISALGFLGIIGSDSNEISPDKVFLVPIGCPMLAGPGTLFTIATFSSEESIVTDISCLFVVLSSIFILLGFQWKSNVFPKTILLLLERLSGLFIMGLGSQMILKGFWNFSDSS